MDLYFKFKFAFEYLLPLLLIGMTTLYFMFKHFKKRK
ncbi:hypothetical protein SAMN05443270_3148 [Lacrimispora sphenoides]|nr:hypothetical protein SAMN05443270_3148 [Lacrimispora sphenoides]